MPQIRAGKKVLIAAHGNSLRALVKYLGTSLSLILFPLFVPYSFVMFIDFALDERVDVDASYLLVLLDNISEEKIVELNIPTGIPLVYELDENLHPVKHYYLADEEAVKAAQAAVANQGKAKQ